LKNILYTKFFNENINEDVNIILSPQFYWIKKIDIKIKSLNEAKKIAKNIFDLEGDYLFDAIKLDNTFFAIAIDKNLELNIDKKYIKSIHLAQIELFEYDEINIDNNHQLKKIEDILFCFPSYNPNAKDIKDILKNIKLSKHSINLFNSIELDKSIIFSLSAIFLFAFLSLSGLIFSYKQIQNELINQKQQLKKYNLPLTNIQLDSILSELENIQFNNILLKKDLKFFTKTPLSKDEKFLLIQTIQNGYKIKIKTSKNLNNYFKQRFNIKSFSLKNSIYEAELSHG